MIPKIVIGANFGDEGKGLVVDALTHKNPNGTVVRFNGGFQCSHTVWPNEDQKHIFRGFGSGTFNNCSTYMTDHTIINIPAFFKEETELMKHVSMPVMKIHPNALLTTPYDMMINWAIEYARGNNRHGSCGYGINETVTRCEHQKYATYAFDVLTPKHLSKILKRIRDEWLPKRLQELELTLDCIAPEDLSDDIIAQFSRDARNFSYHMELTRYIDFENVVFEGAQGLLLDQHHSFFPYVTRSNTGIFNVIGIFEDMDITEAEVYYVTRPYLTRHGAGPLPHGVEGLIYPGIIDETNNPNPFQGTIRYAPLDLSLLTQSINADMSWKGITKLHKNLVITCMNQLPDTMSWIAGGWIKTGTPQMFLDLILKHFGENVYVSSSKYGRDLTQIEEYRDKL